MPISLAICSMMAVLPIPGAPIRKTGRCWYAGIKYSPVESLAKYAVMAFLIYSFACLIFIDGSFSIYFRVS